MTKSGWDSIGRDCCRQRGWLQPYASPRTVADRGARGRQRFAVDQGLVDADRLHPLARMPEQAEHDLVQQAGRGRHRPERPPAFGDGSIGGMHVGCRASLANKGGSAAELVRMAVRENEMLEVPQRAAQLSNGVESDYRESQRRP